MLSVRGVSGGRALRAEVPAGTWLAKGICRPVRRPAADGSAGPTAERHRARSWAQRREGLG